MCNAEYPRLRPYGRRPRSDAGVCPGVACEADARVGGPGHWHGSGILALLACQAGAQKVYAVEQDGIIQVARESAARNGYTDRIEFIQALSTAIDLPEPVDVIVSEIHGILPFFPGSLASIIDARNRFLKPGGVLIPMRETVSVAVVTLPDRYERIVGPWAPSFGLDCAAGL